MKPNRIIAPNPSTQRDFPNLDDDVYLEVAEFFCDTIQGEGVNMGVPAVFLRLQGCTLNCKWCDTEKVWREGSPYTIAELFSLMELPQFDVIHKLLSGHHLVITGGSPLKQQFALVEFLTQFKVLYGFIPYVEIENEAVLRPTSELLSMVSCWNNSPKLANSGNSIKARYKPDILRFMSRTNNSWFKFVISNGTDWEEIQEYYLTTGLISIDQIILMPKGATRNELEVIREFVVELAIKKHVRYSTREHIVLWDTAISL